MQQPQPQLLLLPPPPLPLVPREVEPVRQSMTLRRGRRWWLWRGLEFRRVSCDRWQKPLLDLYSTVLI